MILENIFKILFFVLLIFALYIHLRAENYIGGGFQSGLVIAATIILYSIVKKKNIPVKILQKLSALGVLIYFSLGIITMFFGGSFLSYKVLVADKILGQQIGIFIVELGVALTVSSAFAIIYFTLDLK